MVSCGEAGRDDAREKGLVTTMATQRIPRSKSALYTTDGKRRKNRERLSRRRCFRRAAETGAPRIVDIVQLQSWRHEQGEGAHDDR